MQPASVLIPRIDANCAVFRSALVHTKPTEVASLKASTWKVVSGSDAVSAEHTHSSISLAQAWKQAGNFNWIRWVTYDKNGNERATQLCFRADGTLARARQAGTMPDLDATVARQAYFNTDGSLIKADTAFVVNDPTLYKKVRALPFYSLLH
jgi:hypothetical protein